MKQSVGRILMLVENCYPEDTRVRNEATLLQSAGYEVTVVSFKAGTKPTYQVIEGVRVYRMPRIELFNKTIAERKGLWRRSLVKLKAFLGYAFEYSYFTTVCMIMATYILVRHGFDAIHAHNPPDTLFIVALPFKLLGKKFVFDHHDLCPELYQSRYGTGECLQTRILRATEWCTLRLADITIATNESYKQVQINRGRRDSNSIFIVRNGPSQARMTRALPNARLRSLDKCILVYIGSLNPQDGVDYLIRSLHYLRRDLKRNDFHCVIMGSGDSLQDLRDLSKQCELEDNVELTGFVSDEDLATNLAAADVCVDPDPSSPLNDVSTWIKIMEYMAYAKPIVSFDLAETRYSAQDAALYVRPNDEAAFAVAIATLMDDPDLRKKMGGLGRKRVEDHLQWSVVGRNLLAAYQHLSLTNGTAPIRNETLKAEQSVDLKSRV
jgi:glycosyltransferase involved in cell wall biosynthesis